LVVDCCQVANSQRTWNLDAEHLPDDLGVALEDDLVAGEATGQPGGLVLEVVAAVSLLAAQLATAGQLEALLSTTVGLHLRHGNRSPYVSADNVCSSFVQPPLRAACWLLAAGGKPPAALN
jgi:hypothetical protein